MKIEDQQLLEQVYSEQILEEGVWDQIKHKASNAAGTLGGMASNVGNRLANVVRAPENQKNPVEAQVQTLWNSFRNKTLNAIEKYLKQQSTLLSTEQNANSSFTKQLNAIKEAQKFLQDPPNYIKNNPSASSSSPRSVSDVSGGTASGIESGSKDGSSAVPSAPTVPSRGVAPTPEPAPSSDKPESTEVTASAPKRVDFTTPPSSVSIKPTGDAKSAGISGVPTPDYSKLVTVVANLKQKDPETYKTIKNDLEKVFAENQNFKNYFNLTLLEATKKKPKASAEFAERDEDVRYHGTHPLSVETMKFFSEFRRLCEQFIHNYDKIKKVGEFGKSANRKTFYTADTFLKRLLSILYIPKAGDLQGANPFKDKMK